MFGLPSVAEQSEMMKANLTPTSRVAVVTILTKFLSNTVPPAEFAQHVAESIAQETRKKLGADVVPLDQSEEGEWAMTVNDDFKGYLREQGFDAYIVVIFSNFIVGNALEKYRHLAYRELPVDAIFRVVALPETGDSELLMYTEHPERTVCTAEARKIDYRFVDPEACAEKVADIYRRRLMVTLAN